MREYASMLRKLADLLEAMEPISARDLKIKCIKAATEFEIGDEIRKKLDGFGVRHFEELNDKQRAEMAAWIDRAIEYTVEI